MLLLAVNFAINPRGSITFAWLMREMRFEAVAVMRATSTLAGVVTSVGLAFAGAGPISLAWGSVCTTLVNAAVSLAYRPSGFPLGAGAARASSRALLWFAHDICRRCSSPLPTRRRSLCWERSEPGGRWVLLARQRCRRTIPTPRQRCRVFGLPSRSLPEMHEKGVRRVIRSCGRSPMSRRLAGPLASAWRFLPSRRSDFSSADNGMKQWMPLECSRSVRARLA